MAALLPVAPKTAVAQERPPSVADEPARTDHALSLGVGSNEYDHFAALGYRVRLPAGVQLGVATRHAQVREAFIAGYAVDQGYLGELRLELVVPLYDDGRFWFGVAFEPGAKVYLGGDDRDQRADLADGWGVIFDSAVLANVRLGETITGRAGVKIPFSLEVAPEVMNDRIGTLLVLGANVALGDHAQLFAELETGGIFGSGGDGAKYLIQGTLGARIFFGAGAHARRWGAF